MAIPQSTECTSSDLAVSKVFNKSVLPLVENFLNEAALSVISMIAKDSEPGANIQGLTMCALRKMHPQPGSTITGIDQTKATIANAILQRAEILCRKSLN